MSKPEDNDKIVARVKEVDQFFGGAFGPRYIAFEYSEEHGRWEVFSNAPTPADVLRVIRIMVRKFEAEQVPTYGVVMNEGEPVTGEAVPFNELAGLTPPAASQTDGLTSDGKVQ